MHGNGIGRMNGIDGRGYSLLHVAVQNGHIDLIHYLVLKGLPLDLPDGEGNTAVHWACIKNDIHSLRYLASAGANMAASGMKGFSPLHWAVSLAQVGCVNYLCEKHKNLITSRDAQGRTPLELAREKNDTSLIHVLRHADRDVMFSRKSLSLDDSNRAMFAFLIPFFYYFVIIYGFTNYGVLITLLVLGITTWAVMANALVVLPRKGKVNTAVLGFFYASFMFTLAAYIHRVTRYTFAEHPIQQTLFLIVSFVALFSHLRLVFSDPGFVNTGPGAAQDSLAWLQDLTNDRDVRICPTCRVRRPVRAKHCATTDRCVVRFDHYCAWIGNAVGMANHFEFMIMLGLVIICHACSLPGFITALNLSWDMTVGEMFEAMRADPLLIYLILFQVVNGFWEASLWFQLFSGILGNITMNEKMHSKHYTHFWKDGKFSNPFDLGSAMANLRDFMKPKMNYHHLYYLSGAPPQSRLEV
jgi:palmitoyltransferase ZDHHC13/17